MWDFAREGWEQLVIFFRGGCQIKSVLGGRVAPCCLEAGRMATARQPPLAGARALRHPCPARVCFLVHLLSHL